MPRSAVNLYRFRNEIENQLLVQHRTQKEVLSWLASEGVPITIDILKARCREWGFTRRNATEDPILVERVHDRIPYLATCTSPLA